MNTFKLESKEECKEVKWCQIAASKDQARPILNGLFIDSKKTIGCDGFRIHSIETPAALYDYDDKVIKPVSTITVKPQIQEIEEVPGTFPDYKIIIPTDEPVFKIAIDKKLLADLKTMPGNKAVVLSFTAANRPVKVTCPGSDAMAIIMPMHLPTHTDTEKE